MVTESSGCVYVCVGGGCSLPADPSPVAGDCSRDLTLKEGLPIFIIAHPECYCLDINRSVAE